MTEPRVDLMERTGSPGLEERRVPEKGEQP